jgi:hypothetical protein
LSFTGVGSSISLRAWVLEQDVAHHAAVQQRLPVDARVDALEIGHRRVRVLVLGDHHVAQVHGEVGRAEVELPDVDGVALEGGVHLRLGVAAERLVDEEERDHHRHHQQHDQRRHRHQPASRVRATESIPPPHGDSLQQGPCPSRPGAPARVRVRRRKILPPPTWKF